MIPHEMLSRRAFVGAALGALVSTKLPFALTGGVEAPFRELGSLRRFATPGSVWLTVEEPNTSWKVLARATGWQIGPCATTDAGVPVRVIRSEVIRRPLDSVAEGRRLAGSTGTLVLVVFQLDTIDLEVWPPAVVPDVDLLVGVGAPEFDALDDPNEIPSRFWIPVTVKVPGTRGLARYAIERSTA